MCPPREFDRARWIGSAPAAPPSGGFRPRFGVPIELFGVPVTLGPEHGIAVALAYVVAGVEGACALVVLFLLFLYVRAAPEEPTAPSGPRTPRQPVAREPGVRGFLRHLFGPVPEGNAITIGAGESTEGLSELVAPTKPVAVPAAPKGSPSKPIPVRTVADASPADAAAAAEARRAAGLAAQPCSSASLNGGSFSMAGSASWQRG
jgi:hypothetical protein